MIFVWKTIQLKVLELFDHPFAKLVSGALASLFSTPIILVIGVLGFWTLKLGALVFYAYRSKYLDIDVALKELLRDFYIDIVLHTFTLIGLTMLANMLGAPFVQLYGFGAICTTEFYSIIKIQYGDRSTTKFIKNLEEKIGVDSPIYRNKSKKDDNEKS